MPIPACVSAFLITCGLQRRSVLNKTQMQANKLQFRSPGFEALPGYRCSGDDLLAPDTRRLRTAETGRHRRKRRPDGPDAPHARRASCDAATRRQIISTVANRHRTATFGTVRPLMQELLQQIDPDHYRSARLLIVRAEFEQYAKRARGSLTLKVGAHPSRL
jgi:hypothetical protein